MLHHPLRLHLHPTKDLVKNLISYKFHLATITAVLIQIMKLCLALIELVEVCLFQGDTGVRLVHADCQVVLDALNGHVLAHRAELLIDVSVVVIFVLPLLAQ